jgi:hypothetical protein
MTRTARVERLVRAYAMAYADVPTRSAARVQALRGRIRAVVPLLTRDETDAYYAAVQELRQRPTARELGCGDE